MSINDATPDEWDAVRAMVSARVNTRREEIAATLPFEEFPMAVGDVTSTARGSGARANGNKAPLDLIPVSVWRNNWRDRMKNSAAVMDIMYALEAFQAGDDNALSSYLKGIDLTGSVNVFEYGARKYAAWNWAKGMPWSVPLGCALRHIDADLSGELYDYESGETHMAHAISNVVMLAYFLNTYPEGDDRPIFDKE